MKAFLIAAVAAIALSSPAVSAPVHAKPAPPPLPTCSVGDVTAEGSDALACAVYEGNDTLGNDPSGYAVNVNSIFGHDDWQFLAKDEDGASNAVGLEVTGLGDLSGLWSLDTGVLSDFEEFVIVLKSSTYWAAYLFDDNQADDGTWGSFNGKGLSHFTIYVRGTGEGGGGGLPVPEPAALGLLGLGVLGIAMGRRRRS